jgi:nucleoside-diphosphate-sugar epimerase
MKTVGIIGGSGFIGSYVTRQFLNNGYEVKVSTTDISKEEKYQHLRKLYNADQLTISELNVENKAQLEDFAKDCDILVHSGTPFQLDFKDAKTELFDPTIKGTENFLDVVNKASRVKKVVIVASVAAYNTNFPLPPADKTPTDTISETVVPFISEESHPYAQAKFIANETVNNFIKNNTNCDVEITSVSPVGVFGKSLSQREDSTSTGLQYLIKNKIAPNPFVQMLYDSNVEMAIVNVKDVGRAVYKAAIISNLHGKNYLLASETYAMSDLNLMLNNKTPKNQPKIIYQNELATNELGVPFQNVKNTLKQYNT